MNYFRRGLLEKKTVEYRYSTQKHMLCSNKSTLNLFRTIKGKVLEKYEEVLLNRYFDNVIQKMKMKLAEYTEVSPPNLIF